MNSLTGSKRLACVKSFTKEVKLFLLIPLSVFGTIVELKSIINESH